MSKLFILLQLCGNCLSKVIPRPRFVSENDSYKSRHPSWSKRYNVLIYVVGEGRLLT